MLIKHSALKILLGRSNQNNYDKKIITKKDIKYECKLIYIYF